MAQLQAAKVIQGGEIGFYYTMVKWRENKMYWRCVEPSCGIFLHTGLFSANVGDTVAVTREPTPHVHSQQDLSIQEREIILCSKSSVLL
jgi:hypothetical protein